MDSVSGIYQAQPIVNEVQEERKITNESQVLGKNEFLKLLIAEMKYQDPLDPISNKDSIAQMAQFSSLEQMSNLNKSFENLATNQKVNSIVSGAQFIGKDVEALKDEGVVSGKVQSVSIQDNNAILRIQDVEGQFHEVEMANVIEISMPDSEV